MNLTLRRAIDETRQTRRGTRAMTLVLAGLVAVTTAAVVLTAGRAAALERDVLASVDEAGTRMITIYSQDSNGGLEAAAVRRIAGLDGVEWAIGLTPAIDTRNTHIPGARSVSTRTVVGDWRQAIHAPRTPPPGVALVTETGQELAGLAEPVGAMSDTANGSTISIGGRFESHPPLEDLERVIVVTDDPDNPAQVISVIHMVAERAIDVPRLAESAIQLSGVEQRAEIVVETSQNLVDLQRVVSGQLSEFSRLLAAGITAASAAVIAMSLTMISISRRRDFGRRRALGATRADIAVIVSLSAVIPAVVGALVGTAGGHLILLSSGLGLPPLAFGLASAVLTVFAAGLAALPAALLTAFRDPASVLRVP